MFVCKSISIVSFLVGMTVVCPAEAVTPMECQGKITKIDDTVLGYGGQSGGLMLISLTSASCGQVKVWFDDDAVRTKNVMSIAAIAMVAEKQSTIIYDQDLANYGAVGKVLRISVQN